MQTFETRECVTNAENMYFFPLAHSNRRKWRVYCSTIGIQQQLFRRRLFNMCSADVCCWRNLFCFAFDSTNQIPWCFERCSTSVLSKWKAHFLVLRKIEWKKMESGIEAVYIHARRWSQTCARAQLLKCSSVGSRSMCVWMFDDESELLGRTRPFQYWLYCIWFGYLMLPFDRRTQPYGPQAMLFFSYFLFQSDTRNKKIAVILCQCRWLPFLSLFLFQIGRITFSSTSDATIFWMRWITVRSLWKR